MTVLAVAVLCLALLVPKLDATVLLDSSVQVGLNSVLQLTCTATSPLTVEGFSWHFNGAEIDVGSSRYQVTQTGNVGELQIFNVEYADAGRYSCIADYSDGSKENSTEREVMVVTQPVVQATTPVLAEDGTAHLSCSVNTSATLWWTFNGIVIRDGGRYSIVKSGTNITLIIDMVTTQDAGDYVCRAGNSVGSDQTTVVLQDGSKENSTEREVMVVIPPDITTPPTELSTANIPVCCAGVQLNLANPDNPLDVRVLVNGTPHPPNQVTRTGSFLYIMGLQAGTEYSLNITLSNIFGTVSVNTTVRPLLGRPSTPQVALTPTAGGLTVQLTVMYPGTREDTLQYSISTTPSPLSRRQTGQQSLPVTDLTTPTSGSAEVSLGPGTYSVTVTVINQHGSTTSVPQQVTIPDTPGSGSVETAVIIGVVVAVAMVILLIIITVFVTVLVCVKHKTTTLCRCCNSNFEDGEVTPSQAQTEPQPYEEFVAIGGMTSESVAMEENPADQPAEPPQYEYVVGVTSSDVQMEENPAYQSLDTAALQQTEEPDYI